MEEAYKYPTESGKRPQLLPLVADQHLPYLVPAVVFWIISLTFHYIDTNGLLSKYKLHTPAEDLTKNRASKWDVIKFALIQQAAQCALGYYMADDQESTVPHEQAIASWAHLLTKMSMSHAPSVTSLPQNNSAVWFPANPVELEISGTKTDQLIGWDVVIAKLIYWVLVPSFQYTAAMVLADTMQYFTHRFFHVNKWLYKHVHSMHHDIYVPFAYGAFYNHPLETIPIDGILFPICLSIARLDNRQAAFFGIIWTFKTVVDHCGYDFPYNPCNIVCPNSVLYHDLHHQSWGMKFNFSVYGSVWDRLMGTYWSPHDDKAQEKYSRSRFKAELVASKQKENRSSTGESSAVELGPKFLQEICSKT